MTYLDSECRHTGRARATEYKHFYGPPHTKIKYLFVHHLTTLLSDLVTVKLFSEKYKTENNAESQCAGDSGSISYL